MRPAALPAAARRPSRARRSRSSSTATLPGRPGRAGAVDDGAAGDEQVGGHASSRPPVGPSLEQHVFQAANGRAASRPAERRSGVTWNDRRSDACDGAPTTRPRASRPSFAGWNQWPFQVIAEAPVERPRCDLDGDAHENAPADRGRRCRDGPRVGPGRHRRARVGAGLSLRVVGRGGRRVAYAGPALRARRVRASIGRARWRPAARSSAWTCRFGRIRPVIRCAIGPMRRSSTVSRRDSTRRSRCGPRSRCRSSATSGPGTP